MPKSRKPTVPDEKTPVPKKKLPVLEEYLSAVGLAKIRLLDLNDLGSHADIMPKLPGIAPNPRGMEAFLSIIFRAVDEKVEGIPPTDPSA